VLSESSHAAVTWQMVAPHFVEGGNTVLLEQQRLLVAAGFYQNPWIDRHFCYLMLLNWLFEIIFLSGKVQMMAFCGQRQKVLVDLRRFVETVH